MTSFLDTLRSDAAELVDQDLPSSEELRSVVGALAGRLEQLEVKVFGQVEQSLQDPPGTVQPQATPEQPQATPAATAAAQAQVEAEASARAQKEQELAAAQKLVSQLQSEIAAE